MRAMVGCHVLRIKKPLAARIFQWGTGLLLDRNINIQTVGGVWDGCMGTPRQRNLFRKRFK
jgi:hypothetical protein